MITLSRDGTKILRPWAESDRALMQGDDHRGGGQLMNLSKIDRLYIWWRLHRFNEYSQLLTTASSVQTAEFYQGMREAELWKILTRAQLCTDLSPTQSLNDEQWNQAIAFIEQFQGGQQ